MRRDLVEAASRGDHEAFEVLATSAGDRLYAVARLILREPHLAEDAVQEALVRAWQQLPSLGDPDDEVRSARPPQRSTLRGGTSTTVPSEMRIKRRNP